MFQKYYITETLPHMEKTNHGEKQKYYVSGTNPPIIDRETFEIVQKLLRERRVPYSNTNHFLSGKLYCAECGATFKYKKRICGACWVCRKHDNSAIKCFVKPVSPEYIYSAFMNLYNKLKNQYDVIFLPLLSQLQELKTKKFSSNQQYMKISKNIAQLKEQIRSYVTLALAISNAALTKKFCSPHISESDNLRYSARVWLINLGLNGEEFRNCRKHLISHLDGCISWRHPEDAIAQHERLKQKRIATCERRVEPVGEVQEQCESLSDEAEQVTVNDFEEEYEQEEFEESMDFSMSM